MASTAVALQLRRRHRTMQKPAFVHFFSSSSSDSNMEDQNTTPSSPSPSQPQFSSSSYFSDVKASLRQNPPRQLQQRQSRHPFPLSTPPSSQASSKVASLAGIRNNLAEFRTRSSSPPAVDRSSSPPPLQGQVSFQELYKRNVMSTGQDSSNGASKGGGFSFDAIRESLRKLRSNATKNQADNSDPMSLKKFKESLKLRPVDPNAREPTVVLVGTGNLPRSVFEKELQEKAAPESLAMKTMFLRTYSFNDLGKKLRALRPEAKQGNWFSLGELNERLNKLREKDKKEQQSGNGDFYKDLRISLVQLHTSEEEKLKKPTNQRLDFLGQFGRTPDFMLAPPKENLVEKYFHPDNMSSSEKLNLELQKVRDEFKMSESDCGSARVQVAQLTTKIKHLSTVLHKKDKHSRKGLQEMVERRKKLLTYLRRTDWDSYCLVLSKFGLRDNPDFLKVDPNYNKIIKSKKKPKKKSKA